MLGIIVVAIVVSMSAVSASDLTNSTLDNNLTDVSEVSHVLSAAPDDEVPDEPDLVLNDTIYLDSDNFDDYFTKNTLKSTFSGKTFIFNQNFENLGKLDIRAKNVTFKGIGYTLKNTVFQVDADDVTLSDLNLVLDSEFGENDGAAIEIFSNNVLINGVSIEYVVPKNVEAYGIYAMGYENDPLKNLKIINSYINFEGHNDDVNVFNCALKIMDCQDALIENNTIVSALPLKDIIFGPGGAELASDLVLTVGIEGCNNISFIGNSLFSEVNKRPELHADK